MDHRVITSELLVAFQSHLFTEERSTGTVEKYLRDLRQFTAWMGTEAVSKEAVAAWKSHLLSAAYSPATINGKLAALNAFLIFTIGQIVGSNRSNCSADCSARPVRN